MTDTTRRSSESGLVRQVYVRRGRKQLTMSTRTLIPAIRQGKLVRDDEFSTDGVHWSRIGDHPQLSRFFPDADAEDTETPAENPIPSRVKDQLYNLARLMRDINNR